MRTITEMHESHMHWVAVAILLAAIKFLLGTAALLFEAQAAALATGEAIAGAAAMLVFIFSAIRFALRAARLFYSLSGPADLRRRARLREDGFTSESLKTAALFSLVCTAGMLWILDVIAEQLAVPGQFFVKLPLFVCCASFSITYFVLGRGAGEDLPASEPA